MLAGRVPHATVRGTLGSVQHAPRATIQMRRLLLDGKPMGPDRYVFRDELGAASGFSTSIGCSG
jgi:hypothetical protein